MKNWKNKESKKLFEALLQPTNVDEMARFCRDLMTESEIEELSGRWIAAIELDKGVSQRKVTDKTGVSIATVTRVNKWLKRGMNGYREVLDKLSTTDHRHPHLRVYK